MSRPLQIMRPKQVAELLGIHRVTLHRWVRAGRFPAPRQLGPNTTGWATHVVETWIAQLPGGPR